MTLSGFDMVEEIILDCILETLHHEPVSRWKCLARPYIVVVEADRSNDLLGWIGWTLLVLVSKLCWQCMISHLISPVKGKGLSCTFVIIYLSVFY